MKYMYSLVGPVLFILIWALIVAVGLVDSFLLPSPYQTLHTLMVLIIQGTIVGDFCATLLRVATAFVAAAIIGLPLGLWLGSSLVRYRSVEFIIDLFRSTPATALFPLFLLTFGIGDMAKIAVAAFASALIVIFNTAYGALHASKARVLAVEIMGASKFQIFRLVLFWESLPQLLVGLRSAVSMSLIIIVVTEMFIGTHVGLGRKIVDAQMTYDIAPMYAMILLTGMTGYVLNVVLLQIEKRLLHWNTGSGG